MIRQFLTKLSEQTSVVIILRRIVELGFRTQKAAIKSHLLPLRQDDIVLDIGCGTGEFAPLFPASQYEGLDIDPSNIAYAKRHYPHSFRVGDATKLPFQDKSFSRVLVVGVLHHLSLADCAKTLQEIGRVLTLGGRALIMEDTKSSRWITRVMHHLDQGAFIRSETEWRDLLQKHLSVTKQWTFDNGVCFYSAFVLAHEN